jgi:hypothetical protein
MPTCSASLLVLFASFFLVSQNARAQAEQPPNDSVRVTVVVNEDGSNTAYQMDPANHKGSATTTAANGTVLSKTEYVLDDAGRPATGKSYGTHDKLLFSSVYKYDAAGRLREEDRFEKDNRPAGKIVYDYDAAGRQTGYSVFDRNGQVIGGASPPVPPKGRR